MGQVPDLKRLTKESLSAELRPSLEGWIFILNSHMEQVRNIFDGNIDFTNLVFQPIVLSFTTNDQAQSINTLKFQLQKSRRITGLVPTSLRITSNNTSYPSQSPFISFSQDGNVITILNIAGLSKNTQYELSLITIS